MITVTHYALAAIGEYVIQLRKSAAVLGVTPNPSGGYADLLVADPVYSTAGIEGRTFITTINGGQVEALGLTLVYIASCLVLPSGPPPQAGFVSMLPTTWHVFERIDDAARQQERASATTELVRIANRLRLN